MTLINEQISQCAMAHVFYMQYVLWLTIASCLASEMDLEKAHGC